MTDKEIKKYCSGVDCLTCDEAEPCIYRIANKLQEQLNRKEQECEDLKKKLNQSMYLSEGTLRLYSKRKNIKYKQALDEIKKYLDTQQKYFDGEDYHNLLEIINEAKESTVD